MIKFLVIVSIIWAIVSFIGWVAVIQQLKKAKTQQQLDRMLKGFQVWTIAVDLLCIAFWIWLFVR